jgi:hypothetical protein
MPALPLLLLLLLVVPILASIGTKQGSIVKLADSPSREEFQELAATVQKLRDEVQKMHAEVGRQTSPKPGVGGITVADPAAAVTTLARVAVGRAVPQDNTNCHSYKSVVGGGTAQATEKGDFVVNTESLQCRAAATGVPLQCTFLISKQKGAHVSGKVHAWTATKPQNKDVFYIFATGTAGTNTYRGVGSVGAPGTLVANASYPIQYKATISLWDKAVYNIEVRLAVASEYASADLPCCASEECVDKDFTLQGPKDWDCKKCCLAECYDKPRACPAGGIYKAIVVRQNFVWRVNTNCLFQVDASSLPLPAGPLPYCGALHVKTTVGDG